MVSFSKQDFRSFIETELGGYENCQKCMKDFIDDYYKNKEFSYDKLYEKVQNALREEKYYKICDGFYTAIS